MNVNRPLIRIATNSVTSALPHSPGTSAFDWLSSTPPRTAAIAAPAIMLATIHLRLHTSSSLPPREPEDNEDDVIKGEEDRVGDHSPRSHLVGHNERQVDCENCNRQASHDPGTA